MTELNRAMSMAENGQTSQALSLANTLVEEHPDFVPALKLQGALLEQAGRAPEAEHAYAMALKALPGDSELLFKLASFRLAAGDNDQAVAFLLRYLRVRPKDWEALFYLAQAYHLKGQDDLALKAIRECVKINPAEAHVQQVYGELLSNSGESQLGLEWLLKAKQIDPALERLDFDIGLAYYYNMDFAKAASYSARAVEKEPNDVETLKLLASTQERLAHWQQSQSAFERALAIEGSDLDALQGIAHCELELRNFQPAIDTSRKVLKLDPSRSVAHYYLSRALTGIGKTEEAQAEVELYRKMQQMNIVLPALGTEGGEAAWDRARELLRENREDDALRQFQENSKGTVETEGDSCVLVGSLYLSMGDEKDGLRLLHRALEIEPTVRGAHTYLAEDALENNDLTTAEKEFEAELANDPNYLPAMAGLGEERYVQGRWMDAADLLAKSRTRSPRLLYMLCDSYFHLGKVRDAELTAKVLAAYAQNTPEVMDELVDLLKRNGEPALALQLSGNPTH
jgi:tetratricopeptide (TPR) repeat protein